MPRVTIAAGGGASPSRVPAAGLVRATTAPMATRLLCAATGTVAGATPRPMLGAEAPALTTGAKLADPARSAASASRWKDECMPPQTARGHLTLPSRGRNDRVRPPMTAEVRSAGYWNQPSMSTMALTLPAALNRSTSPWSGPATVSICTTVRFGRTSPALRLMSDASGSATLAGYIVRYVAAVGAIAVRLAMIATAVAPVGTEPCPATVMSATPLAAIGWPAHPAPPMRVSQMRVGWIAWYWAPAAAVALPNHPPASIRTLIEPAALYTQSDVSLPPGDEGPSPIITRFAATRPAVRLIVENFGALLPLYGHVPLEVVGDRLR